jgi:dTDP-glucose 4,6-dehydratase
MTHIPEDYRGAPDTMDVRSAYGEGKRMAELLCSIYAKQYGIETKIARCFAFVGPHLPLDGDFAIGNFIRDSIKDNHIRVNGDGTPYRSYLYAADLAIWLWTILVKGTVCYPYNVGSDQRISILDLAYTVSQVFDLKSEILTDQKPTPGSCVDWYIPSINRATSGLNLQPLTSLEESISRTALNLKKKSRRPT